LPFLNFINLQKQSALQKPAARFEETSPGGTVLHSIYNTLQNRVQRGLYFVQQTKWMIAESGYKAIVQLHFLCIIKTFEVRMVEVWNVNLRVIYINSSHKSVSPPPDPCWKTGTAMFLDDNVLLLSVSRSETGPRSAV